MTRSSPSAPWRRAPSPWRPRWAREVRAALEGLQVAQAVVAQQDDVPAVAAVAAVGPAARHVGLATEGEAAVPATARLHEDASLVVEHDPDPLEQRTRMADDDGKVFLITGASTGIGAETARQAAEAGHRLVLAARSRDRLEALSEELGGAQRALAVGCDVMDWGEQERLAAAALDAFGRIDVVFANAGFGAKRGFLEETPEHWRDMVLTNVLGVAYTIRATLPAVKDARGHVLLTSSVAGRRALQGSLYSATKAGTDVSHAISRTRRTSARTGTARPAAAPGDAGAVPPQRVAVVVVAGQHVHRHSAAAPAAPARARTRSRTRRPRGRRSRAQLRAAGSSARTSATAAASASAEPRSAGPTFTCGSLELRDQPPRPPPAGRGAPRRRHRRAPRARIALAALAGSSRRATTSSRSRANSGSSSSPASSARRRRRRRARPPPRGGCAAGARTACPAPRCARGARRSARAARRRPRP